MIIKPRPLTAQAFKPFGQVIETNGHKPVMINDDTTERYHALAGVDVGEGGGIISIFRGTRRPLEIKMLERHPLGSQAFYPLENTHWLLVVSQAERPGSEDLEAFIASGEQGVQYAKGVWHHPLLVLQETQDFLVVDREGAGENLEEVFFDSVMVELGQ
jgi:ureidoglycolate lyase